MASKWTKIDWPRAVVAVALIAGATCVAIWAPEDIRAPLASLLTALAVALRPALGRGL